MSQSPGTLMDTASVDRKSAYLKNWDRVFDMIRDGRSWSGHERNCCFLNTGGPRFADVSAVSGLDFDDDARSIAPVDWDHDGDLDLWITNRSQPRLRFMKNEMGDRKNFLALRLEGRSCNRDAIGARVEVKLNGRSVGRKNQDDDPSSRFSRVSFTKTLRAGEGFLGQGSKWLHFGLGNNSKIDEVLIHWPDGKEERISPISPNEHYRIVQGSGTALPWKRNPTSDEPLPSVSKLPEKTAQASILLSRSCPLPTLEYQSFSGDQIPLETESSPLLVSFWASWCQPCLAELKELAARRDEIEIAGIRVLALSVDAVDQSEVSSQTAALDLIGQLQFPFPAGNATEELLDKLQIVQDRLFDRRITFPLPMSLLIDSQGHLAGVYRGRLEIDELFKHVRAIPLDAQARHELALPRSGRWCVFPTAKHNLHHVMNDLMDGGYRGDVVRMLTENWSTVSKDPLYSSLLVNSGVGLFQNQQVNQSLRFLQAACELNPQSPTAHHNLALALSGVGRASEAETHFETAIRIAPEDPDSRVGLAAVLVKSGRRGAAIEQLHEVVRLKPQDPGALFNLAMLQLDDGQIAESTLRFDEWLNLQNGAADATLAVAKGFDRHGNLPEAITYYREAVRTDSELVEAHLRLGVALETTGELTEATTHYHECLQRTPDDVRALNNLAWILASHPDPDMRDGERAWEYSEKACQLTEYRIAETMDTLAAAQAASGSFEVAVETASKAIELAETKDQSELAEQIRLRLIEYQQRRPWVQK